MQKIVEELKQVVSFKDTTDIGDIVLIAAKEPQMLFYAHVNDIVRDTSRKDEWWHVHFTMLSIPQQKIEWTLRTAQITGQEIFTMGGEERFIKAISFESGGDKQGTDTAKPQNKVSPLKRVK